MRHPLFHWSLPPSERWFVVRAGLGLSFLALVASRTMLSVAINQGIFSLARLAAIAAISGSLPLYVLARRYACQSAGRAAGVSFGGMLVALSPFFADDTLGFIVMLSGAVLVIRHISAGPAPD